MEGLSPQDPNFPGSLVIYGLKYFAGPKYLWHSLPSVVRVTVHSIMIAEMQAV